MNTTHEKRLKGLHALLAESFSDPATPPFTVVSDGIQLVDWKPVSNTGGSVLFASAVGGLELAWKITPRGAGWEFESHLTNVSENPSGLLSRIEFFRLQYAIAFDDLPVIHHCGGGLTDAVFPSTAWRIQRTELPDWSALKLEGYQGRSSNKDLPLFLVSDEADEGGLAFAVGYSGNVVSTILREMDYQSVVVSESIKDFQIRLPAGETVRLGSVLVVPYEGDSITGKNLLRRVLREDVCPRPVHPAGLPGAPYTHWFGIESQFTAESLLREAEAVAALGAETFEVDAAVFQQGTHPHYGAGNWGVEDPEKFPEGLLAFANRVRERGLRFGLWFEPETVEEGTLLHREHPEWLIRRPAPHDKRHLLDFGNQAAVDHITRMIGDLIEKYGVKWSRVDSNLNPDEYWATIADPGERGLRELRHWQGWYRFLDSLRERFPDLHIEGCSSGGRRIDLEMLKRSHCFWISDNTNFPATIHQHIGGANHFLPSHLLHMEVVKYPLFPQKVRPYNQTGDETFTDFWLITLMGGLFGLGGPVSAYPSAVHEKFSRFIAEYKRNRKNLMGDFYPLLPQPSTSTDWDAWQFHNPATDYGQVMVFKMRGSTTDGKFALRGLHAQKSYRLSSFPESKEFVVSGAELMSEGLAANLPHPHSGVLFSYSPLN
jgi:alpha-galactosidase